MDIMVLLKEIAEAHCYKIDMPKVLYNQPNSIKDIFSNNDSHELRKIIGGDKIFADRTTIFNF